MYFVKYLVILGIFSIYIHINIIPNMANTAIETTKNRFEIFLFVFFLAVMLKTL